MVIESVEGLDPCFDKDVEIVTQGVLIGNCLRRDTGVFRDGDAIGDHRIDGVFERTEGVTIGCEERNALESWVGQYFDPVVGVMEEVPEFHMGATARAKPKPTRSKANFIPADISSMGAKVEANLPIEAEIDASAFLMAS